MQKTHNKNYILYRHKLLKILSAVNTDLGSKVYNFIRDNNKKHYVSLSVEDNKKITYASKPEHITSDTRRVCTSLGKYIRSFIDKTCVQSELDEYVDIVMSILLDIKDDDFKFLSGKDIVEAYKKNFAYKSCMSGTDEYVKIYSLNDNVRMLILDKNDIKGRALVWHTTCGKYVMDRVYPSNPVILNLFLAYASRNNFITRPHNSLPDSLIKTLDYSVKLYNNSNVWPYLDTFCWADSVNPNGYTTFMTKGGRYLFNVDDGSYEDCEDEYDEYDDDCCDEDYCEDD